MGLFLLNYPVLSIYNIPQTLFGIPLLYLMVFLFWCLLIGITYLVIRKTNKK